ncbi:MULTISPECIES: competence protein CoiA family protein [Clostridia]|uniref:competence protein CoiA n=1 Tax=Clostridia TaxID=186801 RepID=UPI000EA3D486|nr:MULTISPECIES: competence protein CoiA family protein [Clostridia]NBJ70924.1 hypothetical protein [Roseburia sp. 1XD42-34]RKI75567.1 hypothetical protein D7V87_15885 [Clostridium sp. 1xD42-85]
MLQAIDQYGNKVILFTKSFREIVDIKKSGQDFHCPVCKGAVYIRAGKKVIPHFAHRSIKECRSFEGGEGVYHEQGKMLLFRWLSEQKLAVQLEPYIKEIKQRPDILLNIGKKRIAIEYQCATTSPEVLKARTEGYRSIGISPLWVLGAKHLQRSSTNKLRVNTFIRFFIHQFSLNISPRIFFLCPSTKHIIIVQDLYMVTKQTALGNLTTHPLRQVTFLELFHDTRFTREKLYTLWNKEKLVFRTKPRNRLSNLELQWHRWLYSKNLYLQTLPPIIYLPLRSQIIMQTPLWKWQSQWVIEQLVWCKIGRAINIEPETSMIDKNSSLNEDLPLISNTYNPLEEYMSILHQLGIFRQLSKTTFVKQATIYFPTTIDEAVAADKRLLHTLKKQNKGMFCR